MNLSHFIFLGATLLVPAAHAQAPAPTPATQKPSNLIAPAIDNLSQTVSQVQLEKWKGSVRDETDTNLRSMERDIGTTLPSLVTAADAEPASLVLTLPLLRNLDALCAVLIRVSVTARGNAPTSQADALVNALLTLQSARNTLSTQADSLAVAQQAQLIQLRASVAALNAKAATTPPPAPPAPTKPRRPKKTTKPVEKTAPASSKAAPANSTKPAQP